MSRLFGKLWRDDRGALLASEFLFMFSMLVIGTVSGLVAMRQALVSELVETANAVMALEQSYSFSGQSNGAASTGGSSASDHTNSITLGSVPAGSAPLNQAACD